MSMSTAEFEAVLRRCADARTDCCIRLGTTSMRLVSNVPHFRGLSFFSDRAHMAPGSAVDHELWCLDDPGGRLRATLPPSPGEQTYRARSFEIGYYATDHFGRPIALYQFENRHYLLGVDLEEPMWSYFVKFFIFTRSLADGHLFLKAAAVAYGDECVLVAGRGEGGKSTFIQQACLHGAEFVTNSHAIVDRGTLAGVASTMRVRPTASSPPIIGGAPALRDGETLVDPLANAPKGSDRWRPIQAVCIVDHIPGREEGMTEIDAGMELHFMEHFSLGLNVYRLEEEMLESCDHDLAKFGLRMASLRAQLREMTERVPCYLVRTDVFDPAKRRGIFETLGALSRSHA